MPHLPASLLHHRVRANDDSSVLLGEVRYAPAKSLWFGAMASGGAIGGVLCFTWPALFVFLATTGTVLLLGHSLGSHRKLIHDSFQCPKWLEYTLVWFGVQVGLAGPIGLLRQHELRDYAQRLPDCHDYLRHGRSFWRDAWWQLHCELRLAHPPQLTLEPRTANDRFYRWLERTWMLQQLPPALLLHAWGGWAFVCWGVCARVTAGVLGHWLIGWFAHNRGGMHHVVDGAAVQGRNIRFTSLLTMGECWHNNHHAFPGSARLGLFAGEWDPGWWMLMLLRRAGLVWGLRLPAALAPRPELRPLDAAARSLSVQRDDEGSRRAVRPPRLGEIWHWCRQGRLACTMHGPAAHLSARALRRLIGPTVGFHLRPQARRLGLTIEGRQLQGLPALCIAWSQRGKAARLISLALAPMAVMAERLRMACDLG